MWQEQMEEPSTKCLISFPQGPWKWSEFKELSPEEPKETEQLDILGGTGQEEKDIG